MPLCHFREAGQRLCHSPYLAGNIHVPHLIAVARTAAALGLRSLSKDVCAVVKAVPHPKAHILGDKQSLCSYSLVVHKVGDVDESCQLLMHRVVRRPHPLFVVVGTIHLYEHTMLGRYGVEIAVAVMREVLLVAVEVGPCAFHLAQLGLGCQVASLAVASQRLIIDEGALLTATKFIDHRADVRLQLSFLLCIGAGGVGHSQRTHVVPAAMPLEFRCRRVPSVGLGIAFRRQTVCVAVIVELLPHVKGEELVDVKVAVVCQAIIAVDAHLVQWQRLCNRRG